MRFVALIITAFALTVSAASAATLNVHIDSSARFPIPAGARNVMIGNPSIADVNIVDGRNMVVLGRAYGSTSILLINGRGRTIMDGTILVSPPEVGHVTMVRANAQSNYSCSPRCERLAMPGEPQAPYEDYAAAYKSYAGRVSEGQASGTNPAP